MGNLPHKQIGWSQESNLLWEVLKQLDLFEGTVGMLTDVVPSSRTLTINGVSQDLSADRTWTILGTAIGVVPNYSALPTAPSVPGEFYWVEEPQGTQWLPGALGGTYYNAGLYYSNGIEWTYMETPYQATQAEVDAGVNFNKFLTPLTFENAAKWNTKQNALTLTTVGSGGPATLIGDVLNIPIYTGGGGGGQTENFNFRFDTTTTAADPGSGKFRYNNANPTLVTEIYLDRFTDNGLDMDNILSAIKGDWEIYIQQTDDSTKFFQYNTSTAYVNNTGWWTIPVSFYQQGPGGGLANNAKCTFLFINKNQPESIITQTITDGDTAHAPSGDAVFDALALKQNVLTNPVTGTGTVNVIPKWSSATGLVDSNLSDDGTFITANTDMVINFIRAGQGPGIGAGNTVFGGSALNANSGGNNNTAIGGLALNANTNGNQNTAIGYSALRSNTTGTNNVVIGYNAMGNPSTNSSNVIIGFQSFSSSLSGNNNVMVGNQAGRYLANGISQLTNASSGVFIGNNTRSSANGNTNEIVIGDTAIGNGTNTVTIGSSIITDNYFTGNVRGGAFIKTGAPATNILLANGTDIPQSTFALASSTHNPVTIGTANGLSLAVQVLSLALASTSTTGALSSTDWNTFNNKLSAEVDTLQSVTTRGATTSTSITATSFIKSGGLSTQFLKADGSIDSNVYALNSALANYVLKTGDTMSGNLTMATGSSVVLNSQFAGVNRDVKLTNASQTDSFSTVSLYPNTGTNVGSGIFVIPKGTGYSAAIKTQISIMNTDYVADGINYEHMAIRGGGTSFSIATGKNGTGVVRPLLLSAGYGDLATNPNQMWLYASGNVGINTASDAGFRFDVQGTTRLGNTVTMQTVPTTSAGAYDILTRNTGTGVVEKIPSSTYALSATTLDINGVVQNLSANRQWRTAMADTGVLTYAGATMASATTINVGAVTGVIVNNETTPGTPTYTNVSYAGASGITVPTIGSGPATYVLLNNAGALVFQNTLPTSAQRKTMIYLSKISHPNLTSISFVVDEVDFVTSPLQQSRDWFQVIQYMKTGIVPTGNAGLTINTTSGSLIGDGINFVADRTNPNTISIAAGAPRNFLLLNQTGAAGAFVTAIDPTTYDNGGTTTVIGGGTNNSTIQYLYYAPGVGFAIQRGQTIYPTLVDAISAVGRESFVVRPNLVNNSILIAAIVMRHTASAMNDPAYVRILPSDKFGQIGGAASGIAVSTLQTAYNNGSLILTSTLAGPATVRAGVADTDIQLRVQNLISTNTFTVAGNGNVTANSFIKQGGLSTEFLMADGSVSTGGGGGSGTVTSVGLALPSIFSVTGSPVTLSGTLTGTLVSQTANTVFAAPNGSAGTPVFRSLVAADIPALPYQAPITPAALTKVDDTNITLTLGGTPGTALLQAVSITAGWTGTLADARIASSANWNTAYTNRITSLTTTGSSGAATLSSNVLNIPNYTLAGLGGINFASVISGFVTGANSTVLNTDTLEVAIEKLQGQMNAKGSGTVTSVAALTLGTTGTDLNSSVANGTTTPVITLNVPTASATNRGALSSADWTTFNNKQSALTNPITGTAAGTTNYIPKYTGALTLGNSGVSDNGDSLLYLSSLAGTSTTSLFALTGANGTRATVSARGHLNLTINSGTAEVGTIGLSQPGGNPGILMTGNGTGRVDVRMNSQTGGIAFGTGPTGSFPGTQMLIENNGNVMISASDDGINRLQIGGYAIATGYRIPGGTSAQFLMADGSTSAGGGGGGISGSGTTDFVPKWTGATAQGNSNIATWPSGTVGIGYASDSGNGDALEVNGSIAAGGFRTDLGTGNQQLLANGTIASFSIRITTSVSITSTTTGVDAVSGTGAQFQNGRNVIIANGANAINYTCNGGIMAATYLKTGTAAITFVAGGGRTLVLMSGTAVLNGIAGSTASLMSDGTTDYLYITNF